LTHGVDVSAAYCCADLTSVCGVDVKIVGLVLVGMNNTAAYQRIDCTSEHIMQVLMKLKLTSW